MPYPVSSLKPLREIHTDCVVIRTWTNMARLQLVMKIVALLEMPSIVWGSCAAVGSSGSLRNISQQVDAHDVVLRFNDAPTEGFTVGSRTTHRLVNTNTLVLHLLGLPCPRERIIINSGYPKASACFTRRCPNSEVANLSIAKSIWPFPSAVSGVHGIAHLASRCRSVTVYGMFDNSSRYHYYDTCKPAPVDAWNGDVRAVIARNYPHVHFAAPTSGPFARRKKCSRPPDTFLKKRKQQTCSAGNHTESPRRKSSSTYGHQTTFVAP